MSQEKIEVPLDDKEIWAKVKQEVGEVNHDEDEIQAEPKEEKKEPEKEDVLTESVEEIEAKAAKLGWKKDGGPKTAEEFLRTQPLYEELQRRGKENKELKKTLDKLAVHVEGQRKAGYEQAIADLHQERIEAIELGNVAAVDDIDQRITQTQQDHADLKEEIAPEAQAFVDRNVKWINDPSLEADEMRQFAHKRDAELTGTGLSSEEQLKVIEKDLKFKYPHRFTDESSPQTNSVMSDSMSVRQKNSEEYTFSDLNKEQKECARYFEKHSIMQKDEYIRQLAAAGEIK